MWLPLQELQRSSLSIKTCIWHTRLITDKQNMMPAQLIDLALQDWVYHARSLVT